MISVIAAACLPLATGVSHAQASQQLQGVWHDAVEVPGLAALNAGGNAVGGAVVTEVSCASRGFCGAGGTYHDGSHNQQAFVVNEVHGTWGNAIEIPGLATLNSAGFATLFTISCPSRGNCAAGGYYSTGPGFQNEAFVVNQVHGVWQDAIEVPGTAALNVKGSALVSSLSCASAGNCSAGGTYFDSSFAQQAFVVNQVHGVWQDAIEVPGTAALNGGGIALTNAVSCAAPGSCTAGGEYFDSSFGLHAFVLSEVQGIWGTAIELPGSGPDGRANTVSSLSCTSPGDCVADGYVADEFIYVATEVNGAWVGFEELNNMFTPINNNYALSNETPISCSSAGNCSVGATGAYPTFDSALATEVDGTWGSGFEPSGDAALNVGTNAGVVAMSCPSAGNCSAGGYVAVGNGGQVAAFVVGEEHGTWGTETVLPGSAALNGGNFAVLNSISCARANHCAGGGYYTDAHGVQQGFVVNES